MKLNKCTQHPNHDTYICQKCGHIFCDGCNPSEWRTDITNNEHAGNVCSQCIKAYDVFKKVEQGKKVRATELIKCFTQPVGAQR